MRKTATVSAGIGFVSSGEASFAGTATSGVLTVSDGTQKPHIHLTGDYLGTTFTCASDGSGGVIVTDTTPQEPATAPRLRPVRRRLAPASAAMSLAAAPPAPRSMTLARPRG